MANKRKYSNNQIDNAGKELAKGNLEGNALTILKYWRGLHALPLLETYEGLNKLLIKNSIEAISVSRLKRRPSVIAKLERIYNEGKPTMNLSRMQDLAGCRIVVEDMEALEKIKELILANIPHEKIKVTDYIENPKPDGYRSVHLIEIFEIKEEEFNFINGLRVEIQLRTNLQHIWAAALETVDYFTKQNLKADNGDGDWEEFFRLVSYEFMYEENAHTYKISETRKDIRKKIVKLATKLNVLTNMTKWSSVSPENIGMKNNTHIMLMNLDTGAKKLWIKGYSNDEKSLKDYESTEEKNPDDNTVLANVRNLSDLETAFPSYFANTKEFMKYIKEIINDVESQH